MSGYRSLVEAQGVLYTAERLSSFGCAISTACFCNSPMESAEHLFFHCTLAKSGIDWIQSQLFLAAPLAPSISRRHLLFGFSSDELIVVPRVFVYLLFVLKYCIWSQRNDFRFHSVAPSAIGLLASVKARVRFHLPLSFKRFRSYHRRRYFFVSEEQMLSSVQSGIPPLLVTCKTYLN